MYFRLYEKTFRRENLLLYTQMQAKKNKKTYRTFSNISSLRWKTLYLNFIYLIFILNFPEIESRLFTYLRGKNLYLQVWGFFKGKRKSVEWGEYASPPSLTSPTTVKEVGWGLQGEAGQWAGPLMAPSLGPSQHPRDPQHWRRHRTKPRLRLVWSRELTSGHTSRCLPSLSARYHHWTVILGLRGGLRSGRRDWEKKRRGRIFYGQSLQRSLVKK